MLLFSAELQGGSPGSSSVFSRPLSPMLSPPLHQGTSSSQGPASDETKLCSQLLGPSGFSKPSFKPLMAVFFLQVQTLRTTRLSRVCVLPGRGCVALPGHSVLSSLAVCRGSWRSDRCKELDGLALVVGGRTAQVTKPPPQLVSCQTTRKIFSLQTGFRAWMLQ